MGFLIKVLNATYEVFLAKWNLNIIKSVDMNTNF